MKMKNEPLTAKYPAPPVSHNKRKILLKTLEQLDFTSIETCFISY